MDGRIRIRVLDLDTELRMIMISGLYGKEEKPSAKSGLSSAAGGVLL
jgi:hypothetical protein